MSLGEKSDSFPSASLSKEFEGGGTEECCQCLVKMRTHLALSYQIIFSGHELRRSVCPKSNWAEKNLPSLLEKCRANFE